MVITGLTRNQFVRKHTRVRIPLSPPNKNRNSDTKGLRFLIFCGIIVPDNVIGDEKTCLTLRTKNQKFVS